MKHMDLSTATSESGTGPGLAADGPRGVLVVDDDSEVRRVVEAGLKTHGFAVWSAADGPAGMASYRLYRRSISAVLLDVRMPGRDGPAVLTDLQQVDPAILVCFMTGFAGRYTDQHLLALGARAVFQKPLCLRGLAARLVELTVPLTHAESLTRPSFQTLVPARPGRPACLRDAPGP